MKRFLSIIMVALLAVCMTACESKPTDGGNGESSSVGTKRGPATASKEETESSEVESVASETEDTASEVESEKESDTESKKDSDKDGSKPANKTDIKLSDDLFDFTVEIDGTVYQFPMKSTDFVALGWELDDFYELEEEFDSNSYYFAYYENENDLELCFYITNFAKSAVPFEDTYIAGVNIDTYDFEEEDYDRVKFPKDIQIGKSTADDIKKAFGTPDDTYEPDDRDYVTMTYSKDYYVDVEFTVTDGVLTEVEMENFTAPEDFKEPELKKEIPDYVKDYTAPKKMGKDMQSATVELDGVIYQFPVPLEQLLKDGWELDKDAPETIASEDYEYITLSKDGFELEYVTVYNDTKYETPIEYGLVKTLSIYGYGNDNLPVKFPGNITTTTTLDEFKKAVKGMDFETDEGDGYVLYTFEIETDDDYGTNSIEFQYSTETKELIHIDIDLYY